MFIEQAIQSPLVVNVGDERWSVPKFEAGDWCLLSQSMDADRADVATRGLDAHQKFQLVMFYGVLPMSMQQLRASVKSPRAAQFIPDHCLTRAKVIQRDGKMLAEPHPVDKRKLQVVLQTMTQESRESLAAALTDTEDTQEHEADAGKSEDEGGAGDPLPSAPPSSPTASVA